MNKDSMEKTTPRGTRIILDYHEEIGAPSDKIFPLLCPVAEYDWIDNWSCTLIFTKSGVNEEGCIFTEKIMAPFLFGTDTPTTWITNRYDPENHIIQFIIFAPDNAVVRYTIRLTGMEQAKTGMDAHFELTALNALIPGLNEEELKSRLLGVITLITSSLKHYCETGKMLKG